MHRPIPVPIAAAPATSQRDRAPPRVALTRPARSSAAYDAIAATTHESATSLRSYEPVMPALLVIGPRDAQDSNRGARLGESDNHSTCISRREMATSAGRFRCNAERKTAAQAAVFADRHGSRQAGAGSALARRCVGEHRSSSSSCIAFASIWRMRFGGNLELGWRDRAASPGSSVQPARPRRSRRLRGIERLERFASGRRVCTSSPAPSRASCEGSAASDPAAR